MKSEFVEPRTETEKKCAKCSRVKPLAEFHRQPTGKRGRHSYCKPCANSIARASHKKNYTPAQKRKWELFTRYRIQEEDHAAMLAGQHGLCAICETPMKRVCVDHNHATKQTRGLLCHWCNVRLQTIEDTEYRSRAIAYLQRFNPAFQ